MDAPAECDQEIIDCYILGDDDDLRALCSRHGAGAVRSRAKALGLTKAFVKQCQLSGTRAAMRPCMSCDAGFLSWGKQNRLCRRCTDRTP